MIFYYNLKNITFMVKTLDTLFFAINFKNSLSQVIYTTFMGKLRNFSEWKQNSLNSLRLKSFLEYAYYKNAIEVILNTRTT